MHKEEAKAVVLRQPTALNDQARYLQGFIDGMNEAAKEIKRNATRPKMDGGPVY